MMNEQRACATEEARPAGITNKHLEDVSLELARLEELLAALDLVTDSLPRGEAIHEQMAHDATLGVASAVARQAGEARRALEQLFAIERDARRSA